MYIDFHSHLARPGQRAPAFLRSLFDVDGYLELQEKSQIGLTVLSHVPMDLTGAEQDLDHVCLENDFLGDLIGRYPDRFVALGGVDPWGGKSWLQEAQRLLDGGFTGLCFPTSRQGLYLDAPQAADMLELANERNALVFLHPTESPLKEACMGDRMLDLWIGRPMDTTLCLSRLLLSGTLARFPNIRVVAAHCGGLLPMLIGRLRMLSESMGRRGEGGPQARPPFNGIGRGPERMGPPGRSAEARGPFMMAGNSASVMDQLSRIFVDTAGYHPTAISAAIEVFGVDRVLFGTDNPPVDAMPEETVQMIENLRLTMSDKDRILSGNAAKLLGRTRRNTSTTDYQDVIAI